MAGRDGFAWLMRRDGDDDDARDRDAAGAIVSSVVIGTALWAIVIAVLVFLFGCAAGGGGVR